MLHRITRTDFAYSNALFYGCFRPEGTGAGQTDWPGTCRAGAGGGYGNTGLPQSRDTVSPQNRADRETREKLSVYELAREYRRRTGNRISHVEVVRRLIDASDLQMWPGLLHALYYSVTLIVAHTQRSA